MSEARIRLENTTIRKRYSHVLPPRFAIPRLFWQAGALVVVARHGVVGPDVAFREIPAHTCSSRPSCL